MTGAPAMRLSPLLAALLAGCASTATAPYGGFDEASGPGKLHAIELGGRNLSADLAQQYVLYRGAEFALQTGHAHFVMFEGLPEAAAGQAASASRAGTFRDLPIVSTFVLSLDKPQPRSFDAAATLQKLRTAVNPPATALALHAAGAPLKAAPGFVNVQVIGMGSNRICSGGKWADLPAHDSESARFIQVPVAQRVSLQRRLPANYGLDRCDGEVSFIPETGSSYAFNVAINPAQMYRSFCSVELSRISGEGPTGISLEPTVGKAECR